MTAGALVVLLAACGGGGSESTSGDDATDAGAGGSPTLRVVTRTPARNVLIPSYSSLVLRGDA